ncbi:MAG: CYTH domain-containing protein [Planctomycetota bacterium]
MNAPREQELKLQIADAAEYQRLCNALPGFEREIEQHNTYWDRTDDALRAAEVMLRIRVTEDRAVVTVKRAATRNADGFFEAVELEAEVDRARAILAIERQQLDGLESEVLDGITREFGSCDTLRIWGEMRNLRRCYRLADDLLAEVDRSDYGSGGVFFEVELESADPADARRRLDAALAEVEVELTPSRETKSERLARLLG